MHSLQRRRAGYTLIELLISSAMATALVGGLASSIYVASQALNASDRPTAVRNRNQRALDQMLQDVRHAQRFDERTAQAATFTVADRDGDDVAETIRYAWSGVAGQPLTYRYNSEAPVTVIDNVQNIDLSYQTRLPTAAPLKATVKLQGFNKAKRPSPGQTLDINAPFNLAAGDLLIAAVAIDGDPGGVAPPAGWTEIALGAHDGKVTFGVWWKLAGATEPAAYQFAWGANEQAYGWMMRFIGHDATNPIDDATTDVGDSSSPNSSIVSPTTDLAMILRLAAFEQGDVNNDLPGLSGHVAITADRSSSGSGNVSGAAGYVTQMAAGDSGTAKFKLNNKRKYHSVTIAISPAPGS